MWNVFCLPEWAILCGHLKWSCCENQQTYGGSGEHQSQFHIVSLFVTADCGMVSFSPVIGTSPDWRNRPRKVLPNDMKASDNFSQFRKQ